MTACKVKCLAADIHVIITPAVNDGSRYGTIETSTWNHRGWTFQEQVLSTRIIHFAHNKLYFECRRGVKLDSDERNIESDGLLPSSRTRSMWPRVVGGDLSLMPMLIQVPTPKDWYDRWRRAVGNVNICDFTVPSDKLCAIQGLAGVMAEHVTDSYLTFAGMWLGDLAKQLLWRPSYPWGDGQKLLDIAPSWSWASVKSGITWYPSTRNAAGRHDRDVGFEFPVASNDHFRVLHADICLNGEETQYVLTAEAMLFEVTIAAGSDESTLWLETEIHDGQRVVAFRATMDKRLEMKNGKCVCPGRLAYIHVYGLEPKFFFTGLIVRDVGDGTKWERVGVATLFKQSSLTAVARTIADWNVCLEGAIIKEVHII